MTLLLVLAPTATAQAQLPIPIATVPSVPAAPAAPALTGAAGCANASALPGSVPASTARLAVLCLLNARRAAAGLPALRQSRSLRTAAGHFATSMVRRSFFGHVSPGGSTLRARVAQTSYLSRTRSWSLGENIAYGAGTLGTPAAIVSAWMGSPPHRANILTRFRDVGIGIARGLPTGGSGATFVTDFGARH
jgi:uncharacterized protein YkwD